MQHIVYCLIDILIQNQTVSIYNVLWYINVSWLVLMIYNQIIVQCGQPKWYIMLLKEKISTIYQKYIDMSTHCIVATPLYTFNYYSTHQFVVTGIYVDVQHFYSSTSALYNVVVSKYMLLGNFFKASAWFWFMKKNCLIEDKKEEGAFFKALWLWSVR